MFITTPVANTSAQVSPNVSYITIELYQGYLALVKSLINLADPDYTHLVSNNSDIPGAQGYGVHERFVHYGRAVIELSVGDVHYPWAAADAYPNTFVTADQLLMLADSEPHELIATRMKQIAYFMSTQPAYVRCYFYCSANGAVKAVTVEDEMNMLKFNMIVSYGALN